MTQAPPLTACEGGFALFMFLTGYARTPLTHRRTEEENGVRKNATSPIRPVLYFYLFICGQVEYLLSSLLGREKPAVFARSSCYAYVGYPYELIHTTATMCMWLPGSAHVITLYTPTIPRPPVCYCKTPKRCVLFLLVNYFVLSSLLQIGWRVYMQEGSTASKISIVALGVRGEVSYLTQPQRPFLLLSSHAVPLFDVYVQVPR